MMQWISLRQAQEEAGGTIVVNQHWYLTEDKTRVVEEGDPGGRWLWASPGTAVKLSDAIRLGAVKVQEEPAVQDKAAEAESEANPADEPQEKQAPKAPNKARKQAPNKAATDNTEDK